MENALKVGILTTSMPRYENDNRSPFILELASAIEKMGNQVEIISMHVPNTAKEEIIKNIYIKRLQYFFQRYEFLQDTRAGIPAAWRKNKITIFLVFFFFLRLVIYLIFHGHEYNLLHANWTLASLSAVISKPFHKRPIVTTLHGSDIFSASKNILFRILTKFTLKGSNAIICVSKALKNSIMELGIPENKILVIPNGINTEYFFANKNDTKVKEILFVGSLTRNKGVGFLLDAYSKIYRKFPEFSLRIIGDGPEEELFKNHSKELGLDRKIIFQESIPHNEIGSIMRRSYMFVLPSLQEGFGVVLLEALASGLPCIAFDSGGIKDILGDGRGVLVQPGNVEELYLAIELLIINREMYEKLSEKGLEFSKDFSWNIIATRIINLYKQILRVCD